MCLRWTDAGMLEAERQIRRIVGHAGLAKLALAVEAKIGASPYPRKSCSVTRPAATSEEAASLRHRLKVTRAATEVRRQS